VIGAVPREIAGRAADSPGKALRVLFVIPGPCGDGHSMIFARRQAEALRARHIEVHEFFLESRTSPGALAREFGRFRAISRRLAPDVIHAQFGTVTAAFAVLAAGRLPVLITYRGSDLNPSPGARAWLARWLSQAAALRARRIVCVSEGLRERLWWRWPRVTVLPTGVPAGEFRVRPRDMARRRLGWP
jgi:teichuronic acid biosynthesis glycosyltransferase TuaC